MDYQTAVNFLNSSFPKANEDISELIKNAANQNKRQSLSTLLKSPELLLPLPFVLFHSNANLQDVISYEKYAELMIKKAHNSKNIGLLNIAKAALVVAKG